MKVYTSCYWRYHGRNGVQITPSKPSDGYVYRALPSLYPPWPAIKAWNEAKYLDKDSSKRKRVWDRQAQMYWQQLTRLGAETVISMLHDGDVLLGWHGKQSECFRSVLAEFLRRNGIDVEEI